MDAKEDLAKYGLSSAEAEKLRESGKSNRAEVIRSKSVSRILRDNVCTLFNLINFIIAAALIVVGSWRNLLFMGVVVLNLAIGVVEELRAKRALDRLYILSAPKVTVVRDGKTVEIPAEEVVLSDVVAYSAGDPIVCDGIVLCGSCEVNESLITGEQDPITREKGENLLSGSFVSSGSVRAVCTRVGKDSYLSSLTSSAKEFKKATSEIMDTLKKIIKVISIVIFPLGAFLVYNQMTLESVSVSDAITSASAAIIGMIPEGLMLLTNTVLAASVVKLAGKKVLVRELYCIEALARVDVLCIDKTGTITDGDMTFDKLISLSDCDAESLLPLILYASGDDNATSRALKKRFPEDPGTAPIASVPFSSKTKWSGAFFEGIGTLYLGAPDRLIPDNNEKLLGEISALSKNSRVLLLAKSEEPLKKDRLPENLIPLAAITLKDHLRPSASETLAYFADCGVDIKVISGDSAETVSGVAGAAGLKGAEKALDLTGLDESDIPSVCDEYTVFSRVTPDQKKALVEAFKSRGHTVAMVGDGVNDILALKAADCSIAMASGSAAARNVAELVLASDDFDSMPGIVNEGRRAINNIERTALLFLVKTIYSAILTVAFCFITVNYPFQPIQLTLVSALTIGFPGFVLALEPNYEMIRKGFLKNVISRALPGGVAVAASVILTSAAVSAFSIPDRFRSTVCVVIAGVIGLSVLFTACLPFDRIRAALFFAMTAAFFAGVTLLGKVFLLIPPSRDAFFLILAMTILSVLLFLLAKLAVRCFTKSRDK